MTTVGIPYRRRFTKSALMGVIAPALVGPAVVFPALAGEGLPGADALAAYLSQDEHAIALVMLSLPNCPVCEIVRHQQLLPLTRDDSYRDIGVLRFS